MVRQHPVFWGRIAFAMCLLCVVFWAAPDAEAAPARGRGITVSRGVPVTTPAASAADAGTSSATWFAPFPPGTTGPEWQNGYGQRDFLAMFDNGAKWSTAASHIDVMMLPQMWFLDAPDADVRKVVTGLKARGIAIAVEASALQTNNPQSCGWGIEGFRSNPSEAIVIIERRLQQYGASLSYVAMAESVTFGSVKTGPGYCNWSIDQVANEAARFTREVKAALPSVIIGATECDCAGSANVEAFLESYRQAAGTYPAFLHWDVDWAQPDWPDRALAMETYAKARKVTFGMIYFGNETDGSDAEWVRSAEDHLVTYETHAGGSPDRAIFQSWHRYPQYAMPETDATKMTYLVNRYFATRTTISSLSVSAANGMGERTVTGKIRDSVGRAIKNATVEVALRPEGGSGLVGTYTLTGTVPANATSAIFGVRMNTECECGGSGEVTVYDVRYTEGRSTANRVPDPAFANAAAWGAWGAGQFVTSDTGSGRMFRAQAGPGEAAGLNGTAFAVTPGATYTVTIQARLGAGTEGAGYFAVMFGSGASFQETARARLAFAPQAVTFTAKTDTNGAFRVTLTNTPRTKVRVRSIYAGDAKYLGTIAEAVK